MSTLGEAMLRLSVSSGDRLEDAPVYEVHVAGSEANVAYALARVGLAARWASVLPNNPLGRRVATTLAAGGVDLSAVHWVDEARLGTYFVEFSPSPRPTEVVYDRRASAMAEATVGDFDWDRIFDATALHMSGITSALSPSASAVAKHAMDEAHRRGLHVSFDLNYRRRLWSPARAAAELRELAPLIDLLLCRAGDVEALLGVRGDTTRMAGDLSAQLGIDTVVVTNGPSGSAATTAGSTEAFEQPAYQVDIVDRIGAGDAFAAGVLWGVLEEESLRAGLERGAAMAALKMTLRGDLFRLGSEDVDMLRSGNTVQINR